jgi:GGDEF domain-containing protein
MKKHGLADSMVDDLNRLVPWASNYDGRELEEAISYLIRREKNRRGNPDPLTGLPGYLALTQGPLLHQHLWGREYKLSVTFSGLVLDVRGMSMINDCYGHEAGNELLAGVGEIVRDLRDDAVHIRAVGDAFATFAIADLDDGELRRWRDDLVARFDALGARLLEGWDRVEDAPEACWEPNATVAALRLTVIRPHSWHILGPLLFEEGDRAYTVARAGPTGVQERRIDLDGLP